MRLNNQGQELGALILLRLEERLMGLCQDMRVKQCSNPSYWAVHVPSLFCFLKKCPSGPGMGPGHTGLALTRALESLPKIGPLMKGRAKKDDGTVRQIVQGLLDQTVGDPFDLMRRWYQ